MPDFRCLQIAAMAVEEGGMSAAAARLGISQSAVSQAVGRAERHVGCALVLRDRRPLVATAAGRALVDHVRAIALRTVAALDDVRAVGAEPSVRAIRIGMVDSVASTIGPPLIRRLVRDTPMRRISAFSGLADAHAAALLRDEIDVAITSDAMEDHDGLLRLPLFREPYVLACAAAAAGEIAAMDLRNVLTRRRLVSYSARSQMGAQIARHLRRLRIEQPSRLSFDTSDALLAMVAGDVGVAITTPLCIVQGGRRDDRGVAILPLPKPGVSRELTLIVRRGSGEALADRMAAITREILADDIVPAIAAAVPWLAAGASDMVLRLAATADVR